MATNCNNNITVESLPTRESVDNTDYLIVYNNNVTSKVRFEDIVIGVENVDFYPELIKIISDLDSLTVTTSSNSADWTSVYNTVYTNSADWENLANGHTTTLLNRVSTNIDSWESSTTTVQNNSATWNNSVSTLTQNAGRWDQVADIVLQSQSDWDSAYNATRDGISAIHEALETIEASPWYTYLMGDGGSGGGGPIDQNTLESIYTTVITYSGEWQQGAQFDPALVDTINQTQTDLNSLITFIGTESGDWESAYNDIQLNKQNWDDTYTRVNTTGDFWDYAYNTITNKEFVWDDTTSVVETSKLSWDTAYNTILNKEQDWDQAYDTIIAKESNWDTTHSTVTTNQNNWTYAYNTVQASKTNWDTAYNTILTNQSNWDSTYNTVTNSKSNWDSAYNKIQLSADEWDEVYNTVTSKQNNWDLAYNTVLSRQSTWDQTATLVTDGRSNWDFAYNTILTSSDNWDQAYSLVNNNHTDWTNTAQIVDDNKSNWDFAYNTVVTKQTNWDTTHTRVSNFADDWDEAYNIVIDRRDEWDYVYNTVVDKQSGWDATQTRVTTFGDDWDSVYNTVMSNSAVWFSPPELTALIESSSANWNEAYTAVNTNSADWLTPPVVVANSGYWDAAYTFVNTDSATNNTDYNRTTFVNVTGDTITGSLSVVEELSTDSDLHIIHGDLVFGDDGLAHGHEHTPGETERLTKQDVRDFKSVETAVVTNSATWFAPPVVVANSGHWNDTYNWVASESATNNTGYNQTTFVNAAGDTITGDLVVDQNVTVGGHLDGTTAMFTSITALSSVVDVIDIKVRELSGYDIIDGDFGVEGDITAQNELYITHGDIVFGDSGLDHGHEHTPEEIERLSKQDVRAFKSTETTVYSNSADWTNTYTAVSNNSALWFSPPDLTALIESSSANWNNAYITTSQLSSVWNNTTSIVDIGYTQWDTTAQRVQNFGNDWDSVYNWVQSDSATNNTSYNQTTFVNVTGDTMTGPLCADTNIHLLHGDLVFGDDGLAHGHVHTPEEIETLTKQDVRDFKSVESAVVSNSATWFAPPVVVTNSGNWNNTYNWVSSESGTNNTDYNRTTFVNVTGDTITGDLDIQGQISGTTAVFTSITALSSVFDVVDIKVRELSGYDIIDGDLGVHGNVTAEENLYVTHGDLIFGDSGLAHGHEHTPEEIEALTKQDVRDFKSVEATVATNSASWFAPQVVISNSADWNNTYTAVSETSADWNSTHSSVLDTSADWDNTYTTVSETSASWNSVYSWVKADSATNNTTYNEQTFVNVTGDTITGDLEVQQNFITKLIKSGDDTSALTLLGGDTDSTGSAIKLYGGNQGDSSKDSRIQITGDDVYIGDVFDPIDQNEPWVVRINVDDQNVVFGGLNPIDNSLLTVHGRVTVDDDIKITGNAIVGDKIIFNTNTPTVELTRFDVLDFKSTESTVHTNSADWQSVYAFVNSDSATNNTDYNRTTFVNVTGDTITGDLEITNRVTADEAVFTSLTALSTVVDVIDIRVRELSGYDVIDGDLTVQGDISASGDVYLSEHTLIYSDGETFGSQDSKNSKSVYTFVNTDSATNNTTYNQATFINTSGDTITGDFTVDQSVTIGGHLEGTTAVFSSITALSSVVDVIDIKVRELSGYDIIDGDLGVDGDVTAQNKLYITHGDITFGDSGLAHGHEHTPEDIETLTKYDVRDFKSTESTVHVNSGRWESVYTSVNETSADWDSVYSFVNADSATNNTDYNRTTFVNVTGDLITGPLSSESNLHLLDGEIVFGDDGFTHGHTHTPEDIETFTKQDLRDFKSTHNSVLTTSGDWNSVYMSVNQTSSNWDSTYNSVLTTSSDWDSTYASVLATSSNWDSTHASVLATSSDWDAVYSFVNSDSATNNTDYNRTTFVNVTGDTITGDINVQGHLEGTTAVFTSITALSSVVDVIDIKVRELSGYDIIDGDLGVDGNITTQDELYITHGGVTFGDSGLAHGHEHTPEEIETLTKYDVRDFKSTHNSVLTTSATWDSVYNSVLTTSATWDSVYNSVLNTSATWDAVYSFVNSDSATNNTDYNSSTFVNASGDTITGQLTVDGRVALNSELNMVTGDILFGDGDYEHSEYHHPENLESLTKQDVKDFKSTETSVHETSAYWDSVYSFVNSDSATNNTDYNRTTFVNVTGDTITGDLGVDQNVTIGQHLEGDTARFTSLTALSATFDVVDIKMRELSGYDIIDGDLSVEGDVSAQNNLYVTDGEIIFGDNHFVHGFAHTPEEIEHLTKQDVRDFKSTESTVFTNSGRWESVYTSVNEASADWDSTHTSVYNTSGYWDSVYSFVNTDSATNNTDYNRTTFVNVTGDTITGDVDIQGHLTGTTAVFTSITALSSVVDVIDIKVRELSGYDIIDGDLGVDGDVTAQNKLYITHGDITFGDSGLAHGHEHTPEEIETLTKYDVRDFKSTHNSVLTTSASWDSVYTSVNETSGEWDAVYAFVNADSATNNTDYNRTTFVNVSGDLMTGPLSSESNLHLLDGEIVFGDDGFTHGHTHTPEDIETFTKQDVRDFKSTESTVHGNSGRWESVYSFVNTDSATNNTDYNRTTFVNVTGDTITGDLEIQGHLQGTTAVFTSITALSSVVDVIDIKVRELSGYDIIDGDLGVDGKITIDTDLFISHGGITFGDSGLAHGHEHTPEEIETFTKYDVRDFKSTYNSVLNTSATWDSVYNSVLTTSATWDSVYSSVLGTSGYWDAVYSFVNTDSATNNTDYNSSTFVNASGDTITGDLTVDGRVALNSELNMVTGDILFGDGDYEHDEYHNPENLESLTKQDVKDFKSTEASVHETSGYWDAVYAFVNADSATNNTDYNRTTFVNVTGDTITGDLRVDQNVTIGGHLEGTTAVFTAITALSSVVDVIDIKARELSGYDIIDGNLSVDGDVSAQNNLYVTDGEIIFGDNHMVHGFAHTPEEIEHLTKQDVRDFKSTESTVFTNSARWGAVYDQVNVLSSNWQSTWESVLATSANWDTVYADVSETSATWDAVYSFVNTDSATNNTDYNRTTFVNVTGDTMTGPLCAEANIHLLEGDIVFGDDGLAHGHAHTPEDIEVFSKQNLRDFKSVQSSVYNTSGDWDSVYTSVNQTSSNWDSTHSSVYNTSGDWDSVYSFVNTDSATNNTDYNRTTFVNVTGDTITGGLNIQGHLEGTTAVFTSITALSSVVDVIDIKARELSGYDIIDGNLSVDGDVSAQNNLYVTDGKITFGDNHMVHGFAHTPEEIEDLTKYDVRDFKSTHVSVYDTSANWNTVYTDVSLTSATWDSVYASVKDTSANWDTVYADVSETSATWDAVYSFVNTDSATNNTDYNRTTFVNTSGDTITGSLSVVENFDVDGNTRLRGDLIVDGDVWFTAGGQGGRVTVHLGDNDTDNIVFNADVDSDIKPDKDVTYTLGTSASSWKAIHVQDVQATNDVVAENDLYVTTGDIIFGDNNYSHGYVHTPEEIEHLSKQDVRDFKSTESTVFTNSADWGVVYDQVNLLSSNWQSTWESVLATSANWDTVYADVSETSANWVSTHNSVHNTSANWDTVYADVSETSANWDSVYSFVKSDSATNNSAYNQTTYVDVAGDVMTGVLETQQGIITQTINSGSPTKQLTLYGGSDWSNGSRIELYGTNNDNSDYDGSIYMHTNDLLIGDIYNPIDLHDPWMLRVNVDQQNFIIGGLSAINESMLTVHGRTTIDGDTKITGDINTGGEIIFNTTEPTVTLSRWDVLDFKSTHASVLAHSADWESTHDTVFATSGDWVSTHASVLAHSADWESTHDTVYTVSADWVSTHASVLAHSADWESTHDTVYAVSADWESTHTSVHETSGFWDAVYSFVNTDSATNNTDYNRTTFVNTSGDTINGRLQVTDRITSNEAVFTSLTALSTVVDVIDVKVRELSGYDIIDGDLRVDGDATVDRLLLSEDEDPLTEFIGGQTLNFTSDADSRIDDKYKFTHAVNVYGTGDYYINGVLFESEHSGYGVNWSITDFMGNATMNEVTTVTGVVGQMLNDNFRYIVDAQTITLSGLATGRKYAFTMYGQAWSSDNVTKQAIVTCSESGAVLTVDQDEFENQASDGQLVEYVFVASGPVARITITPDPSSTWHLYAFSNREVWSYGTETLLSRDVTNFKSTHTTTHDNSAKWESVYSFVNGDSATNNSEYNRTTYVNVSGDTMTGALSVMDNLTIDGTTLLSGEMYIDGHSTFNNGVTAESNVYIKGDLRVDGNVWLLAGIGDVINVGETADDVVVFQAPVDSDIYPFKSSERSLGTTTNTWYNVHTDLLTLGGVELSGSQLSGVKDSSLIVQSNSSDWDEAYTTAQTLTADTEHLNDRVDALYHYTINNFDNTSVTYEPTLEEYLSDEYVPGSKQVGDTIVVAAQNKVYVLTNSDGSKLDSWVVVNTKPNTLFYKTNMLDGHVIDSIDITRYKTAKYSIEVTSHDQVMFTELSMITNGKTVELVEYCINHTTQGPFVTFSATLNPETSACELRMNEVDNDETIWSPGALSAQPYTWLDAADESKVVLNNSGEFQRWYNSGKTDLYMYARAGSEPEYITSGVEMLNNKNVLKFSDQSDYIESRYTDGTSVGKWNKDPVVWYLVFKPTGVDNFHDYLLWFEQSTGQDVAIVPSDNDEFFGRVWLKENDIGNGTYPFTNKYSDTDLTDQWNIFELEFDPVQQTCGMHLNGHTIETGAKMNYLFPESAEHMFRLHANWIGSQFTDGYLAEFLVLENYQRIHTEGYLAHKWGLDDKLPSDHVYKHKAPQNVCVFKGNRTNLF